MKAAPRWCILGALMLVLCGCDKMANQPKRLPYELPFGEVAQWPMRPPPYTVAREDKPAPVPKLTLALLQRGQQRFDIYCAPCHARTGDGDGIVVRRGFPHPPSYFIQRLESAPVQHFYDVVTHGYGAMYPYADRVAPADRWAIAAYIRALQASNEAPLSEVPAADRQQLR